jgi:hypothetical protein
MMQIHYIKKLFFATVVILITSTSSYSSQQWNKDEHEEFKFIPIAIGPQGVTGPRGDIYSSYADSSRYLQPQGSMGPQDLNSNVSGYGPTGNYEPLFGHHSIYPIGPQGYAIQTMPGFSGSPIFKEDNFGNIVLLGVHMSNPDPAIQNYKPYDKIMDKGDIDNIIATPNLNFLSSNYLKIQMDAYTNIPWFTNLSTRTDLECIRKIEIDASTYRDPVVSADTLVNNFMTSLSANKTLRSLICIDIQGATLSKPSLTALRNLSFNGPVIRDMEKSSGRYDCYVAAIEINSKLDKTTITPSDIRDLEKPREDIINILYRSPCNAPATAHLQLQLRPKF